MLDLRDEWIITKGSRDFVLHVFFGGEALKAVGFAAQDLLSETFRFTVPSEEWRLIIHFLAVSRDAAALAQLAAKLKDLRGGALDGPPVEFFAVAVNLPSLGPIIWEQHPSGGLTVAPGELWRLGGEFLTDAVDVRVGGGFKSIFASLSEGVVLRAPEETGELTVEAINGAGAQIYSGLLRVEVSAEYFSRGDVDEDEAVNLTDAIRILAYLFQGGTAPRCLDSADTDDNGRLDLTDAMLLLQLLFQGTGESILYPGGLVPGRDPTPDELGCGGAGG